MEPIFQNGHISDHLRKRGYGGASVPISVDGKSIVGVTPIDPFGNVGDSKFEPLGAYKDLPIRNFPKS